MCDRSRSTVSKATGIRKRQPSRRIGCPFSLAVGYRKNHQLWYVRIRNPNHNHGPSEPRKPARKQKKELPPPISAPLPEKAPRQPTPESAPPPPEHLMIPGLRDVALRAYCEWQESHVADALLKVEFRKARDVAHANGFDLEQICLDNDPQFYIEAGVKKGIARRFVTDIKQWAKLCEELN
ncbi:hypothetical protein BO70DRAFT_366354 [Aspergillus heteromorphus CBS 117.55]|uniref:FAR1 domain-containing protein n=1 Tax=Aspergillus heteromorphus CBS 117.55 TaxID=1448321 RepID=A0A317V2V9_9EURO|nr:uncharacterized protein BO70DRAFT_366354 [Aspergillus heteromorphus CBS 117.55]PWY67177.1 hypothetical protein BO70DRAFT_366354 [Aspergillus heteromorphus CBS 117.55]